MVMIVYVSVLILGYDIYLIIIKVYWLFFDNLQVVLVKDVEQDMIIQEMYDKVVEQLICKLLSVQVVDVEVIQQEEKLVVSSVVLVFLGNCVFIMLG